MLRLRSYTATRHVFSSSALVCALLAALALPARSTASNTVPLTQDFGQAQVNGTGSAPVLLNYLFPALSAAPTFSLVYGLDFKLGAPNCIVNAGVTCYVSLTFQPRYPGVRQDAVIVRDNFGNFVGVTLLHGLGLAPEAVVYPGLITTYAGSGMPPGFWGDGQVPTAAQFANPQSVAIDTIGNIYIADSINQVVREISALTGLISTVAGMPFKANYSGDGGQATQASLNNPIAVAVDGAGNLYIADQGNNRIRKVTAATGIISTVAGGAHASSGADHFGDGGPAINAILNGPADVALDASANLYIADAFHGLIRRVDASSGIITVVAGVVSGGASSTGTDGLGDGSPATQAQLANPSGIAVDAGGNLYIADTGHSLIRFVNAASGLISAIAGNGSPGYNGDLGPAVNAELSGPSCVRVDAAGNVYIADTGNDAVRQVQAASGVINTIAGDGASGYYGDGGVSTAANLMSPSGLALDSAGNLYIADNGNNVIRKVVFPVQRMAFGSIDIGLASPAQLLTLENIGNRPLNFTALGVTANFQQQPSGYVDCSPSSSVAAGSNCTIAVEFVPATTFALSGNVTATTNALNVVGSSQVATLSGTGVYAPVPKVALSAVNLVFGNQVVGTSTALPPIFVTNSGNAPLGISNIWVTGANAAEFAVSTTCGAVLGANASCTVTITFTPAAAGARSAALIFNDSVANSPQMVALSGVGVLSPRASLSSTNLTFGSQTIGSTSGAQVITLTSSGSLALPISSAVLSGPNAADFKFTTTCSGTLATGSTCKASVTFSPSASGSRTALLVFTDGAPDSPETVSITGTAVRPGGTTPIGPTPHAPSKANFVVWRPSNGTWFINSGGAAPTLVQQWGLPGDIPVPGDYDGDGKPDFAVWRPSSGTWFVIPSSGGPLIIQQWGLPGDIPVPGDYDGDGKTDFAVWRPANGTWFIMPTTGGTIVRQWGLSGDIPLPGDYDGDGKIDCAVWRPANGTWFIMRSSGGTAVQQWGLPGDIPIPADYDGDGKTDFAVWRPSNGTWFILPSTHTGTFLIQQWGLRGDKPITKDFNGDGKSDLAVWRPSNGTWYVLTMDMLNTYPNPTISQQWGLPGDLPL